MFIFGEVAAVADAWYGHQVGRFLGTGMVVMMTWVPTPLADALRTPLGLAFAWLVGVARLMLGYPHRIVRQGWGRAP